MAASLTEATPSIPSDLERRARHALVGAALAGEPLGRHLGAGAPQAVGLGLAAALGERLGEVGEDQGEPQPEDDLAGEEQVVAAGDEVADEQHGGQDGHDLDHEHDRVADHGAGVELPDGAEERRADEGGAEQG
jgi:hypothetical protein